MFSQWVWRAEIFLGRVVAEEGEVRFPLRGQAQSKGSNMLWGDRLFPGEAVAPARAAGWGLLPNESPELMCGVGCWMWVGGFFSVWHVCVWGRGGTVHSDLL